MWLTFQSSLNGIDQVNMWGFMEEVFANLWNSRMTLGSVINADLWMRDFEIVLGNAWPGENIFRDHYNNASCRHYVKIKGSHMLDGGGVYLIMGWFLFSRMILVIFLP